MGNLFPSPNAQRSTFYREDVMTSACSATIQLESALLCLDLSCNVIFDGSHTRRCPTCGGQDSYPVVVWLNRMEGLSLVSRPGVRPAPAAASVRAA